jgi:hypothetical protein
MTKSTRRTKRRYHKNYHIRHTTVDGVRTKYLRTTNKLPELLTEFPATNGYDIRLAYGWEFVTKSTRWRLEPKFTRSKNTPYPKYQIYAIYEFGVIHRFYITHHRIRIMRQLFLPISGFRVTRSSMRAYHTATANNPRLPLINWTEEPRDNNKAAWDEAVLRGGNSA